MKPGRTSLTLLDTISFPRFALRKTPRCAMRCNNLYAPLTEMPNKSAAFCFMNSPLVK
jgi:hypothetical protein